VRPSLAFTTPLALFGCGRLDGGRDLLLAQEFLTFTRMDETHQPPVQRRGQSLALGLVHHGAIDGVHLGAIAPHQILPHGRPILAQRFLGTDDGAIRIFLVDDGDAACPHDRDLLQAERAHEMLQVLVVQQLATGQTGQCRDRVDHRVVQQLLPDGVVDVLDNVGIESGVAEYLADGLDLGLDLPVLRGDLDRLDAGAIP